MKKILATMCLILFSSILSITIFSFLTGKPEYEDSVIRTKIFSTILKEEREVIIHLPRNYDSMKRYQVIYVLDGSSEDQSIADKVEILSSVGCAPESIVVGLPNVNGKGRQRDYTPPNMRMDIDEVDSPMGQGDKFLLFMEKELFQFIKTRYSVSNVRGLAGNSRGGLLVMYSLLYKPTLFQARFCFSPAFWRDDHLIISKTSEFLKSSANLSTFFYMSLGDREVPKMKNAFAEMAKVLQEKAPDNMVIYSEYTKNSDHQSNSNISASVAIFEWNEFQRSIASK